MDNSINQGGYPINTPIYDNRLQDAFNQPMRVDEVMPTLVYIGWWSDYNKTVDETLPNWKIRKIQQVGTVWVMQYADGNAAFDNVWADRALLNYF
jgi:hypothetical protein